VKVDKEGTLEWSDTFRSSILSKYPASGFGSVDTTVDGNYAIAGDYSGALGFMLMVSSSKEIKSFVEYSDACRIQSIKTTKNGEFFLAGATITLGNGGKDIYVIKTDASGAVISSAYYGTSSDEEANSIQLTRDGGAIIVGYNWVIKTDENGNVE